VPLSAKLKLSYPHSSNIGYPRAGLKKTPENKAAPAFWNRSCFAGRCRTRLIFGPTIEGYDQSRSLTSIWIIGVTGSHVDVLFGTLLIGTAPANLRCWWEVAGAA